MEPRRADVQVFADPTTLAREIASRICALALQGSDRFAICCSGGSTPKLLYEALAEPSIAVRFPWSRVHWFWGDERFVPHDHPDSNFRMIREAMLSKVPAPAANIHSIPTETETAEQAAHQYERELAEFYRSDTLTVSRPLFDVVLLGLGEDGHTASLFPGHSALTESTHWAAPVIGLKPEARITLTYPALNSASNVAFLVTGQAKREVFARARSGELSLPAARINPSGRLHWFCDQAAAP